MQATRARETPEQRGVTLTDWLTDHVPIHARDGTTRYTTSISVHQWPGMCSLAVQYVKIQVKNQVHAARTEETFPCRRQAAFATLVPAHVPRVRNAKLPAGSRFAATSPEPCPAPSKKNASTDQMWGLPAWLVA